MKSLLIAVGLMLTTFSSLAENGGAPGTICQLESGQVITTNLTTCPKNTKKL